MKKVIAVLLTAAMTMSASVLAFGETVTFHFQNASGWENVGGHIYEGVGFTTNVVPTDKAFVVSKNDDGTDKVVWPGYKCEPDKEGWVKATVTFADAANNGIAIIFNNGVGDTKANDVGFSQADADAVIASKIPNDTNATKEQTGNITLGKKAITKAGGVASDYYITYDGKTATMDAAVPDSYTNAAAIGGSTQTPAAGENPAAGETPTAGGSTSTGTGTASGTTAPTTGDTVAVTVVMFGLLAAVAFVASKKKVNA